MKKDKTIVKVILACIAIFCLMQVMDCIDYTLTAIGLLLRESRETLVACFAWVYTTVVTVLKILSVAAIALVVDHTFKLRIFRRN